MNYQLQQFDRNLEMLWSAFGTGSGPLGMGWVAFSIVGILFLLSALAAVKSQSPFAGVQFAVLILLGWIACTTIVLAPVGLYFFARAGALLGSREQRVALTGRRAQAS